MKQIITILICLIGVNVSYAQFGRHHAIYTTGELNLGNYIGVDLNLNYIYKEQYSFKIGYTGNIRPPKSQPENYQSGIFNFGPLDQFENYQLTFGKIFKLSKSGKVRANLSLGLGYTIIREPENWKPLNNGVFGENYSWNYRKHNTVSLIINPKIEFPLARFYGLTVSPMIQINKDRTYFGIGFGQMLGLLRKKTKQRHYY